MSGLFSDNSIKAAKLALDGLSKRQQLISNNIANIDTPGYRAQEVSFESAIQRAIKNNGQVQLAVSKPGHMALSGSHPIYQTKDRPGGTARADENNVDIDVELSEMTETGIQYQAVSQEISKKLALLKTIAMSR
jgi:flagellar basal-body rod protein FlgB